MTNVISWNAEKLASFKKAHANALAANKGTFVWDGHGFLVTYAKYLIEYLEGQFK